MQNLSAIRSICGDFGLIKRCWKFKATEGEKRNGPARVRRRPEADWWEGANTSQHHLLSKRHASVSFLNQGQWVAARGVLARMKRRGHTCA